VGTPLEWLLLICTLSSLITGNSFNPAGELAIGIPQPSDLFLSCPTCGERVINDLVEHPLDPEGPGVCRRCSDRIGQELAEAPAPAEPPNMWDRIVKDED
jgi:hypothetical protein